MCTDGDAIVEEYEHGFNDGFNECQKRYMAILKRFPLQCAAISNRLPLSPSQPDEVLEQVDYLYKELTIK